MTYHAFSTKERYEELKKDPLVFCRFGEITEYPDGRPQTRKGWHSCDETLKLFIEEKELPLNAYGRRLFVIGKEIRSNGNVDEKKQGQDRIFFEIKEFDENNESDWKIVFNDCRYNFKSGNTRFCHMTLFWALYHTTWFETVIRNVISSLNEETSQIVTNYISDNIITLPVTKQFFLSNILKERKPGITPLIIPDVENVLKELSPDSDFRSFGLYYKIDYILNYGANEDERAHLLQLYKTSINKYIHFKYWMNTSNHKLYDYNILEFIYSCVNPEMQLNIIKRYMHDVRLGNVDLNFTFLQMLRDYRYKTYVDIRYFIENAGSNIDLRAPMFCDSLLTIERNEGKKIQDFNGILDFAVRNSNKAYPGIDLGLRHFLPVCNGGLKPNNLFYGFIHYSIVNTFDESLLTEENLKKTAEFILQNYADLQYHFCCTCNSDDRELSEDVISKCQRVVPSLKMNNRNEVEKVKSKCSYIAYKPIYPLRWKRKDKDADKYLNLCVNIKSNKESFTFEDVDLERLKKVLQTWGQKREIVESINGEIPKNIRESEIALHFVRNYYTPTNIKLFPNNDVFYSSNKSLLGAWKMDNALMRDENLREKVARRSESPVVIARTFESLKKMFPQAEVHEAYIVIPYDSKELKRVLDFYHYRSHEYNQENGYADVSSIFMKFLVPKPIHYTYFCTPQLAASNDQVSDLPYFWCRSEECFWNMLDNQTIERENEWRNYSLYHAAEIIGYKLIETSPKGNVAVEAVKNFAGEVRQAEKLYSRLVCRSCGHMIFSKRGSLLNGSRFFECANPSCSQHKVEIYLSQCNRCGTGLIDSRDSERCENGWVICPSCLACCNDELFNSLIARHRRNGWVPTNLLECENKGHNNKGIFFCPTCGSKLEMKKKKEMAKMPDGTMKEIESETEVLTCLNCKKTYEKEYYNYLHPHGR